MLTLNYPNDNKNLPPAGANEFGLLPETEGAQVADHMADRGMGVDFVGKVEKIRLFACGLKRYPARNGSPLYSCINRAR
jgi:hypothetical protein